MKGLIYKFAIAMGLIMASVSASSTVTYVYTDPQGTPLAEADASGAITATFDYKPYGSQALGSPKAGPGYTGHVNDPDTGFVYMQARYYDSVVGRFLSLDPVGISVGNAFSFNIYAYVENSPIVQVDPFGLCPSQSLDNSEPGQCPGSGPLSTPNEPPSKSSDTAPEPKSSPGGAKDLPPVTVHANKLGAIPPPIFRVEGRQIFRKTVFQKLFNLIDDRLSNELVKRLSLHTAKISKAGFLEPAPFTFGAYLMLHSEGLGGCNGHDHCADETRPTHPMKSKTETSDNED